MSSDQKMLVANLVFPENLEDKINNETDSQFCPKTKKQLIYDKKIKAFIQFEK